MAWALSFLALVFEHCRAVVLGVGPKSAQHIAPHNLGMSTSYLWVKAFHIVFVASWFAGLFYLPRIFVNLAMVPQESHAERERLLLMARKLSRFALLLMVPALLLGLALWWMLGWNVGGWMHAKLALVALVLGYQHACHRILYKFEHFENRRSHRWFRVFNEVSVLLFIAIVVLVVVKPF